MTRDDDRDRIAAESVPHGTRSAGRSNGPRDIFITSGLAIRNLARGLKYCGLKIGQPAQIQRHAKPPVASRPIEPELLRPATQSLVIPHQTRPPEATLQLENKLGFSTQSKGDLTNTPVAGRDKNLPQRTL